MATGREPVLILASEGELPGGERVWGRPNRELPAAEREALDWLMLCRFLGWRAELAGGELTRELCRGRRLVLLARDPDLLGEAESAALGAALADEPILAVARAATAGTPMARLSGVAPHELEPVSSVPRWSGPGPARRWVSHLELELPRAALSEGCVPWAFLGSAPLLVARRLGAGTLATTLAHPGLLRDANPSGTGVLKALLTWGAPGPLAWLDLERSLVLRMDDPGSAGNAHLRSWAHRTLEESEWTAIAADLAHRDARMSIGYVPGWIDDGDPDNGTLSVAGEEVERIGAAIHPSPLVEYRAAGLVHDHVGEFRGLQGLRQAGAGEVELHGHTHVRDHGDWVSAADRYDSVSWYRELERLGAGDGNPLEPGRALLAEHFGTRPSSLLCPGQACSQATAERAIESGLGLIATETLGLRDGDRICWDSHVISPGLGWPNGALLESGLPTIACLHDSDPIEHGAGWVANRLDEWTAAGAGALIDFRELAATLACQVELRSGEAGPVLELAGWRPEPGMRGLRVAFRLGGETAPTRLPAEIDGEPAELIAERTAGGWDRAVVPGG